MCSCVESRDQNVGMKIFLLYFMDSSFNCLSEETKRGS